MEVLRIVSSSFGTLRQSPMTYPAQLKPRPSAEGLVVPCPTRGSLYVSNVQAFHLTEPTDQDSGSLDRPRCHLLATQREKKGSRRGYKGDRLSWAQAKGWAKDPVPSVSMVQPLIVRLARSATPSVSLFAAVFLVALCRTLSVTKCWVSV